MQYGNLRKVRLGMDSARVKHCRLRTTAGSSAGNEIAGPTDKDGIVPALLAAELIAGMGRDHGETYRELTRGFGESVYDRVEAPATPARKSHIPRCA